MASARRLPSPAPRAALRCEASMAPGVIASRLSPLAKSDVSGGAGARDVFHALVSQRTHVDSAQQVLAGTQQDGRDGEMQFVDELLAQVLADRGHAASQPD